MTTLVNITSSLDDLNKVTGWGESAKTSPQLLEGAEKGADIQSSAVEIDDAIKKTQKIMPKNLVKAGEDLVSFNTLTNWVFSAGDESKFTVVNESFFGGTNYVHLLDTELGGNSSFRIDKDIDLLNHEYISLYVWSDGYSNYGNITLDFSLSPTSFTNKYSISLKPLTNVKSNEWNNILFKVSDLTPSGTISRTDLIKSLKITVFGISGKQANLKFGGLKFDNISRTSITFSFDDCNQTDYTVAYNKLKSVGFNGISYIISDEIGTTVGVNPSLPRLTLSEMQEMYSNGWFFGVHGKDYFNWVTEKTISEAEVSIKTCRDYLYNNGFIGKGLKHCAYPHGEYNDDVIALLEKYGIKYARTTNLFNQQSPIEDMHKIKLGLALKPTLQENIDALELLMQKGGLINIYGHDMYESNPIKVTPSVFNDFVDYINENYRRYVTTIPDWCDDYETGTII